jgi:hypothetical protein
MKRNEPGKAHCTKTKVQCTNARKKTTPLLAGLDVKTGRVFLVPDLEVDTSDLVCALNGCSARLCVSEDGETLKHAPWDGSTKQPASSGEHIVFSQRVVKSLQAILGQGPAAKRSLCVQTHCCPLGLSTPVTLDIAYHKSQSVRRVYWARDSSHLQDLCHSMIKSEVLRSTEGMRKFQGMETTRAPDSNGLLVFFGCAESVGHVNFRGWEMQAVMPQGLDPIRVGGPGGSPEQWSAEVVGGEVSAWWWWRAATEGLVTTGLPVVRTASSFPASSATALPIMRSPCEVCEKRVRERRAMKLAVRAGLLWLILTREKRCSSDKIEENQTKFQLWATRSFASTLVDFDRSVSEFGPCIGITRRQRLQRKLKYHPHYILPPLLQSAIDWAEVHHPTHLALQTDSVGIDLHTIQVKGVGGSDIYSGYFSKARKLHREMLVDLHIMALSVAGTDDFALPTRQGTTSGTAQKTKAIKATYGTHTE